MTSGRTKRRRSKRLPGGGTSNNLVPIPVLGATQGPLNGWTFLLEPNLRNVYAKDAGGVLRWTVPSSINGGNAVNAARYVEIRGSHVLCVFGDRLLLIDALSNPEGIVIGSEQLILDTQGSNGRASVATGRREFRFRGPEAIDPFGNPVGNVGPMTPQTLCFQRGEDLIGIDPETGRRVWQQGEVPVRCELIGDEEYLLAKPPRSDEFLLFAMSDGRSLGTRPLPDSIAEILAEPEELVDWGRCWLTVSKTGEGDQELAMYDFVDERDRWTITLPADSLWSTVDGSDIVTLTPEGALTVIDHHTGAALRSLQLKEGRDWFRFSLRRHSAGWLLFGVRRLTADDDRRPLTTTRVHSPGYLGSEVNGEMSLIDPAFNEVVWTADVPLHVLPSWQPPEWPILVFACRRSGPRLTGDDIRNSEYFAIQIRDVRTGEQLFEDEVSMQVQPVWDAQPSDLRLEVRYGATVIEASYPDHAAEPEKENDEGPPPPPQQEEP